MKRRTGRMPNGDTPVAHDPIPYFAVARSNARAYALVDPAAPPALVAAASEWVPPQWRPPPRGHSLEPQVWPDGEIENNVI